MIRIFISYTSSDEKFANKLAADLSTYTSDIFYAKWNIKVGDSIVDKINLGLEKHDNIVVILSNSSIQSEWVKRELNSSLMRHLRDKTIKILPILIEDCRIPPLFNDILYADFRTDYNKGLASLLSAFEEDFNLEPYIGLVEAVYTEGPPLYDPKTLAIVLKRFMPLRFGCVSTLSKIYDHGEIAYIDKPCQNSADLQLKMFIDEKLIDVITTKEGKVLKFSDLGKIIYKLISEGLNEGILGTVCSS